MAKNKLKKEIEKDIGDIFKSFHEAMNVIQKRSDLKLQDKSLATIATCLLGLVDLERIKLNKELREKYGD